MSLKAKLDTVLALRSRRERQLAAEVAAHRETVNAAEADVVRGDEALSEGRKAYEQAATNGGGSLEDVMLAMTRQRALYDAFRRLDVDLDGARKAAHAATADMEAAQCEHRKAIRRRMKVEILMARLIRS